MASSMPPPGGPNSSARITRASKVILGSTDSLILSDEEGLNDIDTAGSTGDALPSQPTSNSDTTPPAIDSFHSFVLDKLNDCRRLISEGKSLKKENKTSILRIFDEIAAYKVSPSPAAPQLSHPDTQETLKQTIISEVTKALRTEIASLKKTISPLSSPQPPRQSYASAAKTQTQAQATPPKIPTSKPAIIVSSTKEVITPNDTLKLFRSGVTFRDTNFSPSEIKFVSNNKLRVEFDNEAQRDITLKKIDKAADISAEKSKKLKPMLVIKGIPIEVPCEDLSSIILKQNNLSTHAASDFVFRFKRGNRNDQLYNAVFVVSPPLWRSIIKLGKVNVDHQRVHVEEYAPLLHCYTCLQFGHTRKNCTADKTICSHCASLTHVYKDCPVKKDTKATDCYNCVMFGKKYNRPCNSKHSATSSTCPRYIQALDKLKLRIDYGS